MIKARSLILNDIARQIESKLIFHFFHRFTKIFINLLFKSDNSIAMLKLFSKNQMYFFVYIYFKAQLYNIHFFLRYLILKQQQLFIFSHGKKQKLFSSFQTRKTNWRLYSSYISSLSRKLLNEKPRERRSIDLTLRARVS